MANLTRRRALQMVGMGALAFGLEPLAARAQGLSFPKGAVIRTLFKDYAPGELTTGATLFHEHLSLGEDFGARFRAASQAVLAAQGIKVATAGTAPPPAPAGPDPMRNVAAHGTGIARRAARWRRVHRRCEPGRAPAWT